MTAMRAFRFDGQTLTLDPRAEQPEPAPGGALIRPLRVALPAARTAGRTTEPFVPGSEFVGVVEALHESVDADTRARLLGQRVVGSPIIVCGTCDLCRAGLSNHCRARAVLGRPGADGALADRFRLPARNLVPVPAGLDDDRAAFAWAVASALHAAHVVRVAGRPYVTVLGDNAEGLITAQIVAALNRSVRVLGSRPDRMALCEKWLTGIRHRPIEEAGLRRDQDVVIECTGTPEGVAAALGLVRPRGSIVLSSHPGSANLDQVVEDEITLVGARAGSIGEALALLTRGEVDVISLISRRFRFPDAPKALAAAADPASLRVLVDI